MKSVLLLLVVFFVVRSLKKHLEGRPAKKMDPVPPPPPREAPGAARRDAEEMALDPVCGSYVPLSAAVKSTDGGRTVYFCSEECRTRFTQGEY